MEERSLKGEIGILEGFYGYIWTYRMLGGLLRKKTGV
jgi:hypothetical protein